MPYRNRCGKPLDECKCTYDNPKKSCEEKRVDFLINKYLQRYYCRECRGYEYVTHYVDGQFCHKHGGVLYILQYRPTYKKGKEDAN